MPLPKVQDVAKGRVWTGADASTRGLIDKLGGFWTAASTARKLAGISAETSVVFKKYPRQKSFLEALDEAFGGTSAMVRSLQGLSVLMNSPPIRAVIAADRALPRGGVELRAVNLPTSR
jgi:protease-4